MCKTSPQLVSISVCACVRRLPTVSKWHNRQTRSKAAARNAPKLNCAPELLPFPCLPHSASFSLLKAAPCIFNKAMSCDTGKHQACVTTYTMIRSRKIPPTTISKKMFSTSLSKSHEIELRRKLKFFFTFFDLQHWHFSARWQAGNRKATLRTFDLPPSGVSLPRVAFSTWISVCLL